MDGVKIKPSSLFILKRHLFVLQLHVLNAAERERGRVILLTFMPIIQIISHEKVYILL